MTGLIFHRYPAKSPNEMLLAVALGEHANPSGASIFPSIATLAEMSKQSERKVQYLMKEMLASGWLQLVRIEERGRCRGRPREYRISQDWIDGKPLVRPVDPDAPLEPDEVDGREKGAQRAPFSTGEMGAPESEKGCTEPSKKGARAGAPETKANQQQKQQREACARAGEAAAEKPPLDPDVLAPFPNDWQPDEACRAILKVQQVPMPEIWQVQAFVGHCAGKHIAPRRIPGEFLKWAARERGFAARDAGRAVTTGGQQAVEAADPATRMQAEKAFERLRQLAHRGEFRRDSATEIERFALNAMGGVGAFDTAASADVPKLRARFVAGYCEREQRGQG